MLHIGAALLCLKGYKCLVYFYGKLYGFHSLPPRSGPACASDTAAKVCSEELSMLEQNTDLGSMKKILNSLHAYY